MTYHFNISLGGLVMSENITVEFVDHKNTSTLLGDKYFLEGANLSELESNRSTSSGQGRSMYSSPYAMDSELFWNFKNVVMPTAHCIGILGNILSIIVFMATPLKASALSHYLTALCVSDVIYLVSSLIAWFSKRSYNLIGIVGVCQVVMFALYLSKFLGVWYLLAAHVERYIVHFGSRGCRKWCNTFRTKCIILIIFIFSMVGFLHYIWIFVVQYNGCYPMNDSVEHLKVLYKIELITAIFIPMIIIIIIDVLLCLNVARQSKRPPGKTNNLNKNAQDAVPCWTPGYTLANGSIGGRSPSTRSGDSTPPPPEYDMSRERARASLVCVLMGVLLVCLMLPHSMLRAKLSFANPDPSDPISKSDIWKMEVFEEIVKLNSVYKLFLFVSLLRSFRNGLVYIFRCRCGARSRVVEIPLPETTV